MQAERYLREDPAVAIGKLRLFAERAAKAVSAHLGIYVEERGEFLETLRTLSFRRAFDERLSDLFHTIRKDGNQAIHSGYGNAADALRDLRFAHRIAEWVYRVIRDPAFKAPVFVAPPLSGETPTKSSAELEAALKRISDLEKESARAREETEAERTARLQVATEKEKLWLELSKALTLATETEETRKHDIERYEAELSKIKSAAPAQDSQSARDKAAQALASSFSMDFDEADTRELIDARLCEAGWEADTKTIRHSLGARPEKGKSKAIAEWPCGGGRADYVLFHGLEAIAVIEAKRASKNVPAVLDQAETYAKTILDGGWNAAGGPWQERRVPFVFATNGRPWLKQLAEASGVWFRDVRRTTNIARPLEGWYSPEGLCELLKTDVEESEKKLDDFGFELDFPLRYYQKDAILAAEQAMRKGRREVLLAMATGTGKTKTCIALLYRLLASGLFRRALFLVDRTSLGEQAANAFKETKIKGLRSFADDFGIKELGSEKPDLETRVTISTVQAMVKRLLYSEGGERPGVDEYDLIVVDECHRGYLLDRELSDDELEFRSYEEYVSKYRKVLEYFDAVRVGLTATPAPQTTDIFGEPAHYYSYRQAVIDGYLIDHRPPIHIETKLSTEGIFWHVGEKIEVYRPEIAQVDLFETPDELEFDVSQFNRNVVTREFNRVICEELAKNIDPMGDRKTLVYCATDLHADIVVDELKKAFTAAYGEIPDEAVRKITGAATEPMTLIRRYKNERLPSVAVTVDLLTTGIDVPEICNLVFIRRVNSRILYEQMLGRATRLCEEIGKDYFEIYDAVGLYDTMSEFTDMKPVVANVNIGFAQLVAEITNAGGQTPGAADTARRTALDQFKAKFKRKSARMKDDARAAFEAKTGMSPEEFAERIAFETPGEAAAILSSLPDFGSWLDRLGTGSKMPLPISNHSDELVSVKRKYYIADTAKDYLEQFKAYIESHENEIAALRAVTTKPSSLTRKDLKALLITLDEAGFAESTLHEAFKDATNADVAASVIGYIRRQALGDPLVEWDQRVNGALSRLKSLHSFTPPQAQWLERIAKQMKTELVVDRAVLDSGVFRDQGGFDRINKIFSGGLERTIEELSDLMWNSPA